MTAASHPDAPDDLLVEYVLGTLSAEARARLEHDLGPRLEHELARTREALSALAVALPPVRPSSALRERLMAATRGPARFAPFIDRLARLLDLASDRARELLASLEHPGTWVAGPGSNVSLVHLLGGPATAGADVGFVRVAAGTTFPPHRHLGEEHVLVLQGSYSDSDGSSARAGDLIHAPAGSAHHFTAGPDTDLVYAVVVHGVEIDGFDLAASDPQRV